MDGENSWFLKSILLKQWMREEEKETVARLE